MCTSLEFVNIEYGHCKRTLLKSERCGSVSHYNGTLVYKTLECWRISISDEREVVIPIKILNINHLALYKNNIYSTLHTSTNMVYCNDKLGNIIWEFKFSSPTISSHHDKFGNIYVIGEKCCNVVVLSSDGKHHKQPLYKDDGLSNPTGIDCDRQQNQLLVTNKDGTAFLFKVNT